MTDKSPRHSMSKKSSKTIKQKRADKKHKADPQPGSFVEKSSQVKRVRGS
ncbi:hypothetical protein GCM10009841_29710 [Microlunatus panaciterrae]|uniref:Uncharacterized protein n=1 Tax=Microlunatus panaciterrae TaxID=400768 RepID=A0ABS2RF53_9ACTN|nr:hypothetical protein [Microlunatus panaciterrae]MBM7797631.1 hypothetical protein [Microlunatus panaciterrae]